MSPFGNWELRQDWLRRERARLLSTGNQDRYVAVPHEVTVAEDGRVLVGCLIALPGTAGPLSIPINGQVLPDYEFVAMMTGYSGTLVLPAECAADLVAALNHGRQLRIAQGGESCPMFNLTPSPPASQASSA